MDSLAVIVLIAVLSPPDRSSTFPVTDFHVEEAIEFAEVHNVNCMIEKFPLDKALEAYDHMMSGKVRFRSVIVMD